MAYDEQVADRVRRFLSDQSHVVENKMMGGVCFMLDGNMCCGVRGAALMVRVGREAYERMLALRGVRPLEFGGRRPSGFVVVDPEGYRTDEALSQWLQRGIDFVAALPVKKNAKVGRRGSPQWGKAKDKMVTRK
jgi:TfoX/Sxy family transcriptional regulator of competence genes